MDLDFDVVDLGPADHVEAGDTAPDFTRPLVTDEYWEDVALTELLDDGPVVLVAHPMAGSFPATYVWQALPSREWGDCQVVGLSIATPYAHKRLIEERDLGDEYRLYSDPGNGVAEAYGIAHDLDGMAGVAEPRPAAFVVDTDRTVEYAWVAEEWPDFPPYDELEAAAQDL
ncbi:MAG: redoxin domain-containing protein [Halapricum sp.]